MHIIHCYFYRLYPTVILRLHVQFDTMRCSIGGRIQDREKWTLHLMYTRIRNYIWFVWSFKTIIIIFINAIITIIIIIFTVQLIFFFCTFLYAHLHLKDDQEGAIRLLMINYPQSEPTRIWWTDIVDAFPKDAFVYNSST